MLISSDTIGKKTTIDTQKRIQNIIKKAKKQTTTTTISLRVPIENKEHWKQLADENGITLNDLLVTAIRESIEN